MPSIYPSLIAADQLNLEKIVISLDHLCQGFHCDVMDNHFVSNLTWGPPTVNALAKIATRPLWVHLMVDRPTDMLEKLTLKPGSTISFHIESPVDIAIAIASIREKKWRASLAINPKTSLESAFSYMHLIDQLLIMSVEPGASGQPFIQDSLRKIAILAAKRAELKLTFTIGVDGGITDQNIASICQAGGQDLVVGAALFGKKEPIAALARLYTCTS